MILTDLFESHHACPECGGPAFSDLILAEKKDACYYKVKASAKVWPSAYASGRLVQCRKKGASNYGNKSEGVAEGSEEGNLYSIAIQRYPQLKQVDRETVINALNNAYEDYLMHYGYEGIGPDEESSMIDYAVKGLKQGVAEGEVKQFPKKHRGDLEDTHSCVKCGGDLQGGTYMGHKVKVCIPCKQVYLPPNTGIDQRGNKVDEQGVAEGVAQNLGREAFNKKQGKETNPYSKNREADKHKEWNAGHDQAAKDTHDATRFRKGVAEGAKEDMSKEAKAMASGKCPHCHGPVEKKEHPTLTQYHCAKCGIRASIDKQGVAEGFPHDVDHMPGPVIRNADMTTDNVKTKDKAEWDRATDSINARVFDDMSEFRTDSKGETVVGDSAVWAKWDNATQTGWFNAKGRPLKPWPVKEQGVAEEQLDEKCWDGYQQQGTKNKGGRQVPNCVPAESVAEDQLAEKSVSQAQFRTMAAAAHNPKFAKKVGISPAVAKEFHGADRKQDYKDLPKKADESKSAPKEKEADYGDDYQDMVARVKKLAGLGPLKTVYDPQKRVYRNVPTAVQPKK